MRFSKKKIKVKKKKKIKERRKEIRTSIASRQWRNSRKKSKLHLIDQKIRKTALTIKIHTKHILTQYLTHFWLNSYHPYARTIYIEYTGKLASEFRIAVFINGKISWNQVVLHCKAITKVKSAYTCSNLKSSQ